MKIWREKDKELNTWLWKADFTLNKKRYRPKAFSKSDLDAIITQIKSNAELKKHGLKTFAPPVTLQQIVNERIRELDLSIRSHRQTKTILRDFQKRVGSETAVEALTVSDIRAYVQALKDARRKRRLPPFSPQTINKYLGMISSLLRRANTYFRLLDDFTPPAIPWEKVPRSRIDRVITPEETKLMLEYMRFEGFHRDKKIGRRERESSRAARFDFADMFEIALNTAMRWGEILPLRWSWIDLTRKIIILPGEVTKTGASRRVYLNSRVVEVLKKRRASNESEFVFTSPKTGTARSSRYHFYGIRRICEKLELPFSRAGFTLHTTRHTATSNLLKLSGDFAGTQKQVGHTDRSMTARYAHATDKEMLNLVESLVVNYEGEKEEK